MTSGAFANILNIITLSRYTTLVTYKIFLGMACSDFMVRHNVCFISSRKYHVCSRITFLYIGLGYTKEHMLYTQM